jgi:acyl-CoA synthetase (AMP-forming)/AMP-acid ligase II
MSDISLIPDNTLVHCIKISSATLVLCTPDIAPNVEAALPLLPSNTRALAFEYGSFDDIRATPSIPILHHADLPSLNPNFQPPKVGPQDIANLIYTSGTTGNPKACAILQGFLTFIFATGYDARGNPPRTLSCMPMFHGTCFFTGVAMGAANGGCFILLRKFSARNFWKDCARSKAQRILYVGELCRYLLATPPGEFDKKHQVQVASGNGMRPEVWDKFKERFNIPTVQEFYRSTEVSRQHYKVNIREWQDSITSKSDTESKVQVAWVITVPWVVISKTQPSSCDTIPRQKHHGVIPRPDSA